MSAEIGIADAHIRREERRRRLIALSARYGMLAIFSLIVVVLLVTVPSFRNPTNLLNLLQQNSIIGIVACGMAMMIIVGGFDLSVGAVGAMASVVAAAVFIVFGIPAGVVAALAAGLAVGLLNGNLIAKVGVNPFVATLGTQILVTGLVFVATDARPVYGLPPGWTFVGLGRLGPVPVATIIFGVVAVAVWITLRFTTFGHYIYAVGGNPEASRLSGVPVNRVRIATFAAGGFLAAVAGLVLLGQTNIGQPAAATTWPLTAIAAVVVGGTPLSGGVGSVWGAVLGTLLLGTVGNALNLIGVSPYWQPAVTGLVILTAVGIDSYGRKKTGGVT